MELKKYFKIWYFLTTIATQIALTSRLGAILFLIGKLLRFALFLVFIMVIYSQTQGIQGYSFWQVLFFFATFNLIDTASQFLLREVYRFRYYVLNGTFDYFLTKPMSPLFRSLFGGSDILDIPMLAISIIFVYYSTFKLTTVAPIDLIIYGLLVINALIIALAIHIIVISIGVLTTEVDNTIMLYRDLTQMGRIPVDVYREPISWIITFVIPIGVMMTFPAKALMGLLSTQFVLISIFLSLTIFFLCLRFWKYAIKNYSSVSS